ncbi:MAG: TetR/AcrR family transcriptional regulator [Dehalococcoidia bacterium]|nr:TetR/AcrR family transcriptional regulator [Dehalococcoidia bacterium]
MARIRSEQEYEAKREAYLKAAWQLLLDEGFDALSVNRLIEYTESSKGAFYHYFTSKDQVIEAVIDWALQIALAELQDGIAGSSNDEQTPIRIVDQFLGGTPDRPSYTIRLRRLLIEVRRAGNEPLVQLLTDRTIEICSPWLETVIREGKKKGYFNTKWPAETAELVLLASKSAFLNAADLLLAGPEVENRVEKLRDSYNATCDLCERLLGLKERTLSRLKLKDARVIAESTSW